MFDVTVRITTVGADEDISPTLVTKLESLGFEDYSQDLELIFASDYEGDITIGGKTTKAQSKVYVNSRGDIRKPIVIETSGTELDCTILLSNNYSGGL